MSQPTFILIPETGDEKTPLVDGGYLIPNHLVLRIPSHVDAVEFANALVTNMGDMPLDGVKALFEWGKGCYIWRPNPEGEAATPS